MFFKRLLLATMLAAVTLAQQDLYQFQQPAPYQGQLGLRSTPRLVPVKSGQPVSIGAAPPGTVPAKRIRAQAPPPQQYIQQFDQPLPYSQNVPAVAAFRAQAPPQPQGLLHQPQQPAYYVQQAPQQHQQQHQQHQQQRVIQQQQQQQQQRPTRVLQKQLARDPEEEEEYLGDTNPSYNFAFDVKDDELTNYQNRQEERNEGVTKGSYSVIDPDGYVRTVTYTADAKNGFQAKVTREPTDVKVKFPVPAEAPEEQPARTAARAPQYNQNQYQPQPQVSQYQPNTYQQPQQAYAPVEQSPAYVARRFPQAGGQRQSLRQQ